MFPKQMLVKTGPFCLLCRNAHHGHKVLSQHQVKCQLMTLSGHRMLQAVSLQQSVRFKSMSILEQSAVLFQDGLEIQELPWVIRRLNPREFPFAMGCTYTGDNHLPHHQEDDFIRRLYECTSVQQVS